MKYCPEGFLDIVAVPIFPFLTLRLKTNFNLLSPSFFVLMNFGIWIFFALKSIFKLAGTSKLWCLSSFDLNFGNPVVPLKKC